MLDANTPLEDRVIVIRDVTCGKDPLDIRAAVLIDDDAVVDGNAAAIEEVHDWFDADACNDEIAFQTDASLGDDAGHAMRSLEGGDGVLEDRPNTVCPMKLGQRYCQLPRRARGTAVSSTGRSPRHRGPSGAATPRLPTR